MTREPQDDAVGSVGEEAVKLLGALQDWAKESGVTGGAAAAGLDGRFRAATEHVTTGQDCAYCPVCQLINRVRETDPEVKAHLAAAAGSLLQAAAGLLETRVPDRAKTPTRVEKIDVDGDDGPVSD
jgi:hypothetical protein